MRIGCVTASLLLGLSGCSSDGGSCAGTASCAVANTEWSSKQCDCVPAPVGTADFWSYFAANFEWVEVHPTLQEAVVAADATLLGRFSAVAPGVVIQGDAIEDVYTEVDITVDVVEPIRGDALSVQSLVLTLPPNRRVTERLVASMNSVLPKSPVLLILRKRMSGKYTVVNGYGLWMQTLRGALDAPLEAEEDLELVAPELAGHETVEQLARSLREAFANR